jgi:hypothetical protein
MRLTISSQGRGTTLLELSFALGLIGAVGLSIFSMLILVWFWARKIRP